jgi:hypothetical protein
MMIVTKMTQQLAAVITLKRLQSAPTIQEVLKKALILPSSLVFYQTQLTSNDNNVKKYRH